MRKPTEDIQHFVERRKKITAKLNGAAMVVASHPESGRNGSVGFPYRQDSNLYYLTGFEEPGSILLILPGKSPESVMFVRKKNPERETWDGFRFGPEATQQEFKIDKVYPIEDFEAVAPEHLKGFENVYYRMFKYPEYDVKLKTVLESTRTMFPRTGIGLMSIHDADIFLGEFRLFKSDYEIGNLKKACEISAQSHLAAMKFARPGVTERQVQAVLTHNFYMRGSAREGYNFIVASGNNATTLHYNFNDQLCRSGELLLIDAGAEYNFFTGDITRTFPISGKFSEPQRKVYEGVLRIQKEIINAVKPGITFAKLHAMGEELLTDLMLELGFFSGRREDIMKANQHRAYYPHGIGHWLGMDVHDAGMYYLRGEPRQIEPRMTFTIEPGLYIPADDKNAPPEYRGIGVRIEDNILITTDGNEVMTASAPKEIDELEKIVGIV